MKALIAKMHLVCVREKGHLLIAGGYITTSFHHNSALMSAAYGIAALLGTHVLHRAGKKEAGSKYTPQHLARD
jgi:hypothetical protein